jgi:hypothetical protein
MLYKRLRWFTVCAFIYLAVIFNCISADMNIRFVKLKISRV